MDEFQNIKNLIQEISVSKGLSSAESIFVLEKGLSNIFYGKYMAVFDESYNLYLESADEKIFISSLEDIKRIRRKIFLETSNVKIKNINDLKDSISFEEILLEINKEANKLATSKDWAKYNYLISRHVRGMVILKNNEFYIVNIGLDKIAYLPLSEGDYVTFKRYPFFVKSVVRNFDEGFISIFLSKPRKKPKQERSHKKLTEIFKDGKIGKFVSHKITVLVTDSFVWIYESIEKPVEHAETLYKKEFIKENNSRQIALSEAEICFRQNIKRKKS